MLPLIRRSVGHAENQVTTDAPEQDHALTSGGSKHRHLCRLAGESRLNYGPAKGFSKLHANGAEEDWS
jgi:hypothetical protein